MEGRLAKANREAGKTALQTRELPKDRRTDVVEYVVGILMIRAVEGKDPHANLVSLGMFLERQVYRDVPVQFRVERKIIRKTQAIRHTDIILQNVHVRIRKTRMEIR